MKNQASKTLSSDCFDRVISRQLILSTDYPDCLARFIFEKLDSRTKNSVIIRSHDGNRYVEISITRFRFIVFSLFKQFKKKGLAHGDTVLLASIPGNNELFIALMFAALTSFGIRVLLPMFIETNELLEWLEKTQCRTIFLPEQDILSLHHHDKEKQIISEIKEIAKKRDYSCFDIFSDFNIRTFLYKKIYAFDFTTDILYQNIIRQTSLETESLLITTSGSSGKSKLVAYCQKAFILSCISWQQAGLFNDDILGGRSFTPMFTHTMGIRAFFNAIWTGHPICLINTEWFLEKPETVRYFLLKMKPEHITGGPSIYNLLLELMRCFPELKIELPRSMKTLISSGAPIDPKTVSDIESCLGIKMHNAFGTTETQQALNTLLIDTYGENIRKALGAPLPGIDIGLKKIEGEPELFELFIKSSFGMKRSVDDSKTRLNIPEGYFSTGDIVRISGDNLIYYVGRENKDFIKDGFGVKIPLSTLHKYYEIIIAQIEHIEFYPIKGLPGLAALIFIKNNLDEKGVISEHTIVKKFSAQISEINNRLFKKLEPFEFRHRVINRITLVNSSVPKTVKGNVSSFKIKVLYGKVIDNLIDPLGNRKEVEIINTVEDQATKFSHHHNPYLGKMLMALGIDYTYFKSRKDTLYTIQHGKEVDVLDFTGGFGTNLLGHNNVQINNTVCEFLHNNEIPISDQGSVQKYAGELAEKLNCAVGSITHKDYNVVFGSTGSEAVEIAVHHAFMEWKKSFNNLKRVQFEKYGYKAGDLVKETWEENDRKLANSKVFMIALKDAFHGHSSGARSILGNRTKREAFNNILGINTIFIDDQSNNWQEVIEKEIETAKIKLKKVVWSNNTYTNKEFEYSNIIGAIAEPLIGEGGIRMANFELLHRLSKYDFPLIIDEIQCGLGRSGSFLASKGINANYYLFAKALGGNVSKISATLIEKRRYINKFSDYYSSTFAGGGLAAKVASRTLSIIEEENIPEKAREAGKIITGKLETIKNKYPGIILEITGRGLMQGIKFCDFSKSESFILRCIYNEKCIGLIFSAYLLLKYKIRILPSISSPNVLRIEPSAYITNAEICRLESAIDGLCQDIKQNHIYEIFKPLMDNDPFPDNKGKLPDEGFMYTGIEEPSPQAEKVGIIAHFIYPVSELRALEKDFCKASDTGLRILFNRFQVLMQMKPFTLFSKNILNDKIHFSLIIIPLDTAELEKLFRQKKQKKIIEKIQDGVRLASNLGINTVSLGAYTSIISNNGLSLVESGNTRVITGNTLTAASGIKRLENEIRKHSNEGKEFVLGVVGASGNIGSVITQSFAKSDVPFKKILLVGRNKTKLENLELEISTKKDTKQSNKLEIVTNLSKLQECDIIVVASNTNDPIIFPHHINQKKQVIISDLSIPNAVSEEVFSMHNIIPIIFSSYITLPGEPEFQISSHTPRGAIFCCAAEAILNGLEPLDCSLKGKLTIDAIEKITGIADKFHFFDKIKEANTNKIN